MFCTKKLNIRCNLYILFISSCENTNEIMRHDVIEDIFDFYNVVAEKNNIIERFDKKLLELSIDNGNLIVAIGLVLNRSYRQDG